MIIDGKKISQEILENLKSEISKLGFTPKLIDVLVGQDPVTDSYVKIKEKRSKEVSIDFETQRFPKDISQQELEDNVAKLNLVPNLCGLIIQLPLPSHIDKQRVLDKIDPKFDVDVITSVNLGALFTGMQFFVPATAGAILKILDDQKIDLEGKKILIIGAGDLVGKPLTFLLLQRKATLMVANESTKDLKDLSLNADIIISGTGVPKLINVDMLKDHQVVIDAGTAESAGGISGDVDFELVKDKVALISPVPGGVGPVTVAMLLYNVCQSAKRLTMGSK